MCRFVYIYIPAGDPIRKRGMVGISLTGLKPENVVCLFQARIWISICILLCSGLFNVQWFEVKGSCLFWWCRWNGCEQCKINTAYVIHVQRTPNPYAIMLFKKEKGQIWGRSCPRSYSSRIFFIYLFNQLHITIKVSSFISTNVDVYSIQLG